MTIKVGSLLQVSFGQHREPLFLCMRMLSSVSLNYTKILFFASSKKKKEGKRRRQVVWVAQKRTKGKPCCCLFGLRGLLVLGLYLFHSHTVSFCIFECFAGTYSLAILVRFSAANSSTIAVCSPYQNMLALVLDGGKSRCNLHKRQRNL